MTRLQSFIVLPLILGINGSAWAQVAKGSVIIGNTAANPVPVVTQGTTAVTGTVTLGGTPSVTLSGTPTVSLSGSPDVTIANSPQEPIPITGKVEVIPSPPPAPQNRVLSGAVNGSHTFPVDPPVKVDTLVMSSRDALYIELVGSPGLTVELGAGANMVVPMPPGSYVREINTQCSESDGQCDFFIINMLGPQQNN